MNYANKFQHQAGMVVSARDFLLLEDATGKVMEIVGETAMLDSESGDRDPELKKGSNDYAEDGRKRAGDAQAYLTMKGKVELFEAMVKSFLTTFWTDMPSFTSDEYKALVMSTPSIVLRAADRIESRIGQNREAILAHCAE